MSRRVRLESSGREVQLGRSNFIAQGGEGSVYALGDLAVKVYEDPSCMIPRGKIRELSAVATDDVLAPRDVVFDLSGGAVGYAMARAIDCLPLPKVYPRSWRAANGLGPEAAGRLVLGLRGNVEGLHRSRVLVVDMNEMNFLLREDLSSIVHIDVDSYQTASYPATAIMPSVRDPSTDGFDESTDWYSFAVLSFTIFVGIHPFKGRHPDYGPADLLDRMRDGASALLPDVRIPAPAMPLDVIPPVWRSWYEATFHDGDRSAPPADFRSVPMPTSARIEVGRGRVRLSRLAAAGAPIKQAVPSPNGLVLLLSDGRVEIDGAAIDQRSGSYVAVGRNRAGRPIGVTDKSSYIGPYYHFWNLDEDPRKVSALIGAPNRIDAVFPGDGGRLYIKMQELVLEVETFQERATTTQVGSVSPHASTVHHGVVMHSLLGATYAAVFPAPRECVQVRLGELDGSRVIDAKFTGGGGRDGETGVLQVVAVAADGSSHLYTWHGLRRSAGGFGEHESEEISEPHAVEVVELDTGVAVSIAPGGDRLVVRRPGRRKSKIVPADVLRDAKLFADAGTLLVAIGDEIFSARLSSS